MISILIKDSNGNKIDEFEGGVENIISLTYSEFLNGIGNLVMVLPTKTNMLKLFDGCNIIEIVEDEVVLWRGFGRPSGIGQNVSTISLTQMKSKLSQIPITSAGTVTSVMDALDLIGVPYVLNLPDIAIEDLEYRIGGNVYNFLEELKTLSGYAYDYDGQTVTFGRIGTDRVDIGFLNTSTLEQCSDNPNLSINNIELIPTLSTESVFVYNRDGLQYSTGDGCNNQIVNSDAETLAGLEEVANNTLENASAGYAISFDVPSTNLFKINIGDRVDLSISGMGEPFDTDGYVYILKKEGRLDGCSVIEKVYVAESIVKIPDSAFDGGFNVVNNLYNRVNRLETL